MAIKKLPGASTKGFKKSPSAALGRKPVMKPGSRAGKKADPETMDNAAPVNANPAGTKAVKIKNPFAKTAPKPRKK